MVNDADQENGEIVVRTPEQILKQAVLDIRRLDVDSQKVWELRIGPEVKDKLKERARIIVELPERISESEVLTGQKLPEDEMEDLRSMQYLAQEALKRGNAYELGLILTDTQGPSDVDKPNLLEQLVNRLYPQKPK